MNMNENIFNSNFIPAIFVCACQIGVCVCMYKWMDGWMLSFGIPLLIMNPKIVTLCYPFLSLSYSCPPSPANCQQRVKTEPLHVKQVQPQKEQAQTLTPFKSSILMINESSIQRNESFISSHKMCVENAKQEDFDSPLLS